MKAGLIAVAAVLLSVSVAASATDWTDCADAYERAPFLNWQGGCKVTRQHVPDLHPRDKEGPLGHRYKKGKSKWCRIRAECTVWKCNPDGSGGYNGNLGRWECYKTTVPYRVTNSIKLKHADETWWCPPEPSTGKPGRLSRDCGYTRH